METGVSEKPFWQTVPLAEMDDAQWEALCDGCAKCCLVKLQDEETDEIVSTDIVAICWIRKIAAAPIMPSAQN